MSQARGSASGPLAGWAWKAVISGTSWNWMSSCRGRAGARGNARVVEYSGEWGRGQAAREDGGVPGKLPYLHVDGELGRVGVG